MQDHATNQLHIEVAHAEDPLAGLAHHREGLRQQLVEQLALASKSRLQTAAGVAGIGELLAEFSRQAPQIVIGERLNLLFEKIDIRDKRLEALQLAGIGITQQQLEHRGRTTGKIQLITAHGRARAGESSHSKGSRTRSWSEAMAS